MQLTLFLKLPTKSDNMVMAYDNPNEIIKELFDLLLSKYQNGLEIQMRGSDFIFDCVHLIHYKCHKTNVNRGGSYWFSGLDQKEKK